MGNCLACQSCNGSTLPLTKDNDAVVKARVPLLLHFDVNKTVLLSDSIQMKTIEQGLREGIGDLFWGSVSQKDGAVVWEWNHELPSSNPPAFGKAGAQGRMITYVQHCKSQVKDKAERKKVITSFELVHDRETKAEMERMLRVSLTKMQLEPSVLTADAERAGLKGTTLVMLPAVFHLIALLLRSKCTFAILFRSFGSDHDRIKKEWNAFCEMRHPLFSHLLQGLGPLDGSVCGVPDRRIHRIHTLYRDADGPMLVLDSFTNGPEDQTWDAWAKQKPRPASDTRNGRQYVHDIVLARTVDGIPNMQQWMKQQLMSQETAAIKDDWAWWQWNGESSNAGKLLTMIGGEEETRQLFFDDNIESDNLKIVDCRDATGAPVPPGLALNKLCVTVNPVEALLDDGYFARKLLHCYNDHLDVEDNMGYSLMNEHLRPNTLRANTDGSGLVAVG